MKSCEKKISKKSDFFLYTPSVTAMDAFLYPICTGHFLYKPGYFLHRNSYDSFLLLYIKSGCLHLNLDGSISTAYEGQFVLLDCYRPHTYSTDAECETLWLHYDGKNARPYYNIIQAQLGTIFAPADPSPVLNTLITIYNLFSSASHINEILFSKYMTDILTELATGNALSSDPCGNEQVIEQTIAYITSHLTDDLSVELLASKVSLSIYHFIRIFKKGTGFTPHEYVIISRINTAKFMLRNTRMPIKDICFSSGFSSESVFSTSFKKCVGTTPNKYRTCTPASHNMAP